VIIKLYLFGLYSALEQSCTLVKLLNNLACLGTYLFVIYCCVYDSVILMWPGGHGCARGFNVPAGGGRGHNFLPVTGCGRGHGHRVWLAGAGL
jgi:hypothetical protein